MSFAQIFRESRLALAGLALLAGRLDAANLMTGADEKWRRLQSEHFELYSRNSEGESRRLLYNLELVHAIFFGTFGFTPGRAMPVTVYFFSRDKYFEAYKPEASRKLENIATFYHAEPDRGILTVAPLPSYEAAQQLAFASYTHHLFRLLGETPPVWYGYGVAGIFRNLVINSDTLELGRPDPSQVSRLQVARLIPVEVMLGSDQEAAAFQSDDSYTLLHDESWAMVHYLYFGEHKLPRAGIAEFISYILRNSRRFDAAATRQVFESKVGISYGKLGGDLDHYFRSGRYGYSKRPLPVIPPAKSYAVRSVPLDEINLRLAELALRVNGSPQGKLFLLQADHGPEAVRANEVLGAAAARNGEWDVAADRWDRALAAGTTNPAVLYELAQQEGRKRFARFDLHYRLPDEAADRLRDLLARSIAASPQQAMAYELLAWVEATAREPQVGNVNLVQKHFPRLKEQNRTLLALAVAHLRLGDKPGAAGMLDDLDKAGPDDWVRYGLEHTRAALEGRPVDRAKLPKPAAAGPPGVRVQPGITKPKD